MAKPFLKIEDFICLIDQYQVPIFRFALGIIFLWFGALKVFNVSPVYDFVVTAFPFFALPWMFSLLGIFEVCVSMCLLFNRFLHPALILMILHLFSTLVIFIIKPSLAFDPFPILTMGGEFLVKNIILIISGMLLISKLRKGVCQS